MTERPTFDRARLAYCAGHRDLAKLPLIPPDPLDSLPTMAAQLQREDVHPSKERGR